MNCRIGVRWTIGNVSERGFESLRLSLWGAWRTFGADAVYAVCVNGLSPVEAQRRTGAPPPCPIQWIAADELIPGFIRQQLDPGMAEGVAWKLAPLRLFPDAWELSLDNDCILWELPQALRDRLYGSAGGGALAEDVRACFGVLSHLCPNEPRNAGIRLLPPAFNLEAALRNVLSAPGLPPPPLLKSELDEQGLQTAAMQYAAPLSVVSTDEVTICSPFHPNQQHLGRCGAHFIGLNMSHTPWSYYDRPADEWKAEHWDRHLPELCCRVGLPSHQRAGR